MRVRRGKLVLFATSTPAGAASAFVPSPTRTRDERCNYGIVELWNSGIAE